MKKPFTSQPHEIEITIDLEGNFEATVLGIQGTACTEISAFLDDLGEVVDDRHIPDYYQSIKHTVTTRK